VMSYSIDDRERQIDILGLPPQLHHLRGVRRPVSLGPILGLVLLGQRDSSKSNGANWCRRCARVRAAFPLAHRAGRTHSLDAQIALALDAFGLSKRNDELLVWLRRQKPGPRRPRRPCLFPLLNVQQGRASRPDCAARSSTTFEQIDEFSLAQSRGHARASNERISPKAARRRT